MSLPIEDSAIFVVFAKQLLPKSISLLVVGRWAAEQQQQQCDPTAASVTDDDGDDDVEIEIWF